MKRERMFNKESFEKWLYVEKGVKVEEIENNSSIELLFKEYSEEDEEMDLEEIKRLNNLSKEEKESDLV